MECAKSLAMLSDFRDGALGEAERGEVNSHLALCLPCAGVFRDLNTIVVAATVLREEPGISFPDEHAIWQRMSLSKGPIN